MGKMEGVFKDDYSKHRVENNEHVKHIQIYNSVDYGNEMNVIIILELTNYRKKIFGTEEDGSYYRESNWAVRGIWDKVNKRFKNNVGVYYLPEGRDIIEYRGGLISPELKIIEDFMRYEIK